MQIQYIKNRYPKIPYSFQTGSKSLNGYGESTILMPFQNLIDSACNHTVLQDFLSLLINRKQRIMSILLSCLKNVIRLGKMSMCTQMNLSM